MEAQQFAALHTGFDAAANDHDAPIDPTLIAGEQSARTKSDAIALPGLPIQVTLQSPDELNAPAACFKIGGEGHPNVTDDQWYSHVALMKQAAQRVAN